MYPRLVHIYGPLWIYSYGVMIAVGFALFITMTVRHQLRKTFISKELFFNTVFLGFLGGVIGGRLLHVITNFADFASPVEILYPWIPGFAVLGSIIGALVFVLFYLLIHGIPVFPMLDLAALYAPLFQSVARLGCLFAGCCYGCDGGAVPWSIVFSRPEGFAPLHIPLHPTQLYASVASFIIFVVVQALYKWARPRYGILFCCYVMLENGARFGVDFWRGDRGALIRVWGMDVSVFQVFSFIVFAITLCCTVFLMVSKPREYERLP